MSPVLCTKLFEFSGKCGHPNYPYPGWRDIALAVGAWEETPTRILKVSADATVRTKWRAISAKMFVGNSYNADAMTNYPNADAGISDIFGDVIATLHAEPLFSPEVGMQFGVGPMPQNHVDVHVTCEPIGATYSGSLTLSYRLDR